MWGDLWPIRFGTIRAAVEVAHTLNRRFESEHKMTWNALTAHTARAAWKPSPQGLLHDLNSKNPPPKWLCCFVPGSHRTVNINLVQQCVWNVWKIRDACVSFLSEFVLETYTDTALHSQSTTWRVAISRDRILPATVGFFSWSPASFWTTSILHFTLI